MYSHIGLMARRGQQQQRAPRARAAPAPARLHGRVQRRQHLVRVCLHCDTHNIMSTSRQGNTRRTRATTYRRARRRPAAPRRRARRPCSWVCACASGCRPSSCSAAGSPASTHSLAEHLRRGNSS